MKRTAAVLFAVFCIAGAAWAKAQTEAEPASSAPSVESLFTPSFEASTRPTPYYPVGALERGQEGFAHMCCAARPDRTLDCTVALQEPRNPAFAAGAENFAASHRLTPESYAALMRRPDPSFQLALRWHILPVDDRFERLAADVRERAANLCGPQSGPAPDYVVISAQSVGRHGRLR
jgi:hypothetical protein